MMTIALTANAMSFTQAQREALFLTDKMAYELNLSDEQYDACYEINLDYLMGVSTVDDLYGTYWTRRNFDMGYVLLDWQLTAFRAASYFYRPLYWDAGCWHFGIYARYPRRTFYYFSHPTVYVSYRGGHSWRMNGGRSYYHGRQDHFRRHVDNHVGMRDRFDNRNIHHNNNRGGMNRNDRPKTMINSNRNTNGDRNIRTEQRNRFDRNVQSDRNTHTNRVDRSDRNIRTTPATSATRNFRSDRSSSTRVTVNRGSNPSSLRRSETRSSVTSSFGRGGNSRSGSVKMGGSRGSHNSGNTSSRRNR